jgi:hypothetical protein
MKHSFAGRGTRPFSISNMAFFAARAPGPALRFANLLDPGKNKVILNKVIQSKTVQISVTDL